MSNKPHTAVISIQLEVHSLLDTGECSGHTVKADILKDYSIKPNFLVTISGYTLDDCLKKLQTRLDMLNEQE